MSESQNVVFVSESDGNDDVRVLTHFKLSVFYGFMVLEFRVR